MILDQMAYQRELLAWDEKIALAELEESKAAERVNELKYGKAQFNLQYVVAVIEVQARGTPPAAASFPVK